ncbi:MULTISPECIES: hypothetical protein [Vibrio]|uniref:Uncharacterized protein n=1 Tax=Vibrio casei TaxID=673372 RepID=A0A368LMH2_9VIBR|nr:MULTISPECIES: hypothetical protein [Vibrio]RCS73094.1 hypothetical protein CIK83_05390 [Vibrio casei]SJN40815.1 hypothetical protein FM109_17495 [Vibrio casei]HBV75549.1 hypothetical protein [Vibrio sp.]
MYSYLLSVIPPMLLGAQCVLLLILLKGNICPGQRGRIHKQLPIIAILWLAISPLFWPLASVSVLIFVFFSQVKVSKTRESGPIWLLQLALGFAIAFILFFIIGSERPQGLFILAGMMFLGASFSHVLLLLARTRLQAFHRLLPVVGIVAAMLVSLAILWQTQYYSLNYLHKIIWSLAGCFMLVLAGIVGSTWHLFTNQTIQKLPPICGFMMSFAAMVGFAALLY